MSTGSISFTPDEGFEAKVQTGEGSGTTIKEFLDNNENIKVGHAGLYWDEEGEAHLEEKDGTETLINSCLELGTSGKGKLLVLCEEGIANAVRQLADDDFNHLPSTKTGIVVHYVTEGIARDFGITFDRQPVSLGGGRGKGGSKGDRQAGVIRLSKQEKNSILEKLDMSYYQADIASGKITLQEAFSMIEEQLKRKMYWEDQGYYLSPNKTEGVLLYDWKNIVDRSWGNDGSSNNGSWIYTNQRVEVVLPNIFDNYYADNRSKANKKNARHLLKSSLASTVLMDAARFGITEDAKSTNSVASKKIDNITSQQDILDAVGYDKGGEVKGVHLAKLKLPGMMKPRHIVVDVLEGGKQVLYLYYNGNVKTLSK